MKTEKSSNERKLSFFLYNLINNQLISSNNQQKTFEELLDVLDCTAAELKNTAGIYMSKEGILKTRLKCRNFSLPVEYSKDVVFASIDPKILSDDKALKSYIQERTGDKVRYVKKVYQIENSKWVNYSMFRKPLTSKVRVIYSVENTLTIKALNLKEALDYLRAEYKQEFDRLDSKRVKDSEYLATFSCAKKMWKLGVMEEFILKNYPDVVED